MSMSIKYNKKLLNVLLLDTGKEWGGGTNSMLLLLQHINKDLFNISCCLYYDYFSENNILISETLNSLGISVYFILQHKQSFFIKFCKETIRCLLFFNKNLRKKYLFFIHYFYNIYPNIKKIERLLYSNKYDILYLNNQPSTNIEGYLVAKKFKSSIHIVQHCRTFPFLDKYIISIINKYVSVVISVSDGIKDFFLKSGVYSKLCYRVFNGIDVFQKLPDKIKSLNVLSIMEKNILNIGSVGSLIYRKSYHHLLLALKKLKIKYPSLLWKMIFVGEGAEKKKLITLANEYKIMDRIIFTGFKQDVIEYLMCFDIFILPSSLEGCPRVILEAMLVGTPVIATNIIGINEMIKHNYNGLLFSYGDTDKLMECIYFLCSNINKRKELVAAAKKTVQEKFNLKQYITNIENILQNVCLK